MKNPFKRLFALIIPLAIIFIFSSGYAQHAAPTASVSFYFSNNDKVISVKHAYARLQSAAQHQLKNKTIDLLQLKRIQQGRFSNILGTYQMSKSKRVTADNTERFDTSPYQYLDKKQLITLANLLDSKFNQDSTAIFIPNPAKPIARITVNFKDNPPNINKLIKEVHTVLPQSYNTAYSLYVSNCSPDFSKASVNKIEWIGSELSLKKIKHAFPKQKIIAMHGEALLVYKDHRVEKL